MKFGPNMDIAINAANDPKKFDKISKNKQLSDDEKNETIEQSVGIAHEIALHESSFRQSAQSPLLSDEERANQIDLANKVGGRFVEGLLEENNKSVMEAKSSRKQQIEKPIKELTSDEMIQFLRGKKIINVMDGKMILDVEKLFARDASRPERISGRKGKFSRADIVRLIGGENFILKDEFEKALISGEDCLEKPLFNMPASEDEVYDLEKIKNKNFHFYLWDIKRLTKGGAAIFGKTMMAGNGEEIVTGDFLIVSLIFDYLNGYRDVSGQLIVTDPDNGKQQPINTDILRKYSSFGSNAVSNMAQYLVSDGKKLVDKGLLKMTDFRIYTSGRSGELVRAEKTVSDSQPYLMFNYVRYYMGRQYFSYDGKKIPIKELKFVVLDQNTIGVVRIDPNFKNHETLQYTIEMLSDEEVEAKIEDLQKRKDVGSLGAKSKISDMVMVGAKELKNKIRPWQKVDGAKVRADDDYDSFARRSSSTIDDYDFIKQVSEKFTTECGVGIHNLAWREQMILCTLAQKYPEKFSEIINFTKEFGIDGLKSFVSCEYGMENGNKILSIAKHLENTDAKKIFIEYGLVYELSNKLSKQLHDNPELLDKSGLSKRTRKSLNDNLSEALLRRASEILDVANHVGINKKASAPFYNGQVIEIKSIDEVKNALVVYRDFLEKINSLFSNNGNQSFDLVSKSEFNGVNSYGFDVIDKESGDKSYSKIILRPRGTNNHDTEFEFDGEARFNFLINNEPIGDAIAENSRRAATSFRLDRECFTKDEAGKIISRDNTRQDGQLSLDLGSIYADSGDSNVALGKAVSIGNYLVSRAKNKEAEFYHNKESFYAELGQADVFEKIILMLKEYIENKFVNRP